MSEYERARYERRGDVGVVTIEDPPLNLFGDELIRDLGAALAEAADDSIRAMLVRAEGKYFTGGADVHIFEDKSPDEAAELFEGLLEITHRVEEMPFPTLASVHGLCLTAGFELALACDLIMAARSSRFGLIEIVVGLTPAMGGTQRLAERAGPARARELVMTGELYGAETLERWNVVNFVVDDEELAERSSAFAERLAAGPTRANEATKRMVRAFLEHGVRGADARVGEIAGPLFATEDLPRAVKTFLSEGPGKATFEGR